MRLKISLGNTGENSMQEIQTGDILFVRGKGIISDLVRFFDNGEFSHVAMAVTNCSIIEAQYFTKSRITSVYFDDYEIVRLNLSEKQRQEVINISPSLVGKWYDYIQILSYILKGNFNNPNHLICSEIIARILFLIGRVSDEQHNWIKNYKPNQLYDYLLREVK